MHRLFGIALGLAGVAFWFMPLAEFQFVNMKYPMSLAGSNLAVLTPLTYGVPASMLLFSFFSYRAQRLPQMVAAIVGAVCIAAIYRKLGGGYRPAFSGLSVVSALCVVIPTVDALRSYLSSKRARPEA